MTLFVINREYDAVRSSGYEIDRSAKIDYYFTGIYDHLDEFDRERRIDSDIDSFYDGDANTLCKGDDDELYAVYEKYVNGGYVAIIWQRVKRIGE